MTCKLEAERLLAELRQSLACFVYRGKTHPPKSLQQVVCQAEAAYQRFDFELSFASRTRSRLHRCA